MSTRRMEAPGPFRAAALAPKSEYELSNGHPIRCLPTGGRGAATILDGGSVLRSDPNVRRAGVDAGFSPEAGTLRAPDLSIIPEDVGPGWIEGVPPLALEYADRGQDEPKLQEKIADLLSRGTQHVWVVRLDGVRRVEIYQPGQPVRLVGSGAWLHAPGILANPVLVDALWDANEADKATLANLLQRFGYVSVDAIRGEGREEGREEGRAEGRAEGQQEGTLAALRGALRRVIVARGFTVDDDARARIEAAPAPTLERWLDRVAVGASVIDILGD